MNINKMKEKRRVYVRLTPEEFEYLEANVRKSGLHREPYLRAIIAGSEVVEAPTKEWRKLIRLLSGMANNLNQLARRANESGRMDPDEIRRALAEIHEISTHVKHWWKH